MGKAFADKLFAKTQKVSTDLATKQGAGSSFASAAAQLGSLSHAAAVAVAGEDDDEDAEGEDDEDMSGEAARKAAEDAVKNVPGGNFIPKKWKRVGTRQERKFKIPVVRRDADGKIIGNKGRRRRLPGN